MIADIGATVGTSESPKARPPGKTRKGFQARYPDFVTLIQEFLDFATVLGANALAYGLYLFWNLGKQHEDPSLYWTLNILASLGVVLVFTSVGLYAGTQGIANIEETLKLVKGVFCAAMTVIAISFFIRERQFSRITTALAVPINLFLLVLQRLAVARIYGMLHVRGLGGRRCLIYGAGETGVSVARCLFQSRHLGWIPLGFLDDDPAKVGWSYRVTPGPDGSQLKVLGRWEDFEDVARALEVTDLLVAVPSDHSYQVLERAILGCQSQGIQYHFVPSAGPHFLPSLEFRDLAGIPLFSPRGESHLLFYDFLKRAFDLCASALLLILLFPLLAIMALLIKIDSTGPAIFRQKRTGRGGREFVLYKLRTMDNQAPPYAPTPSSQDDPRITRLGRFLRRTSLDELPQLVNVLKGDMSLVGPRPEMPFIVAIYNERQRQRLNVKPGITGLWQISEDRAFQIHENLEYDLYYVENRSFFLDLAILIQTFFSALRGIGAW